MSQTTDRFLTCIHESGHAVGLIAVGARVKSISVDGGGKTFGLYPDTEKHPTRYHKQRATVCLMGKAAELVYQFGDGPTARNSLLAAAHSAIADDFSGHRVSASAVARDASRGPIRYSREDVTRQAVDRALRDVRQYWPAIVEIAEHLDRRGRLHGEVVQTIYECAIADPWGV